MPDTLGGIRSRAREAARGAGVSLRDVDLLLADLIGRDPVYLVANDDRVVSDEERVRFEERLERRLSGEPIQYIRGHCEFFGRTFAVDSRVLIPRPETELLCEKVLAIARPGMRVVDVGCGSGAIAITLALEMPELCVTATDVSFDALAVARGNARNLGARVAFVQGDLLSQIRAAIPLIVSNPPYIPAEQMDGLQREVVRHEPHLALSGGPGGMDIISRLASEAVARLAPAGTLAMEIGWDQKERVMAVGESLGLRVEVHDDLAGLPRCAFLAKR